MAAAGTVWSAVPLLWPSAVSDVTWGSVLFAIAVATVAVFVGRTAAGACRTGDWAADGKSVVLLVLLVMVPVVFDPRTVDKHNLAKLTVTVVGALVLAAVWVAEALTRLSWPRWRNGLHWPVLGLVGWTALTTGTSVSPRLSVLGDQGTYDGLLATASFTAIFFATVQTMTIDRIKTALAVLYFGGGGLTVLYGLIQLHDRVLATGSSWDWISRIDGESTRSFAGGRIFSTFGNPNHLAGFLAVLVPVGLVLLVLYRSQKVRLLVAAILAGMLVELLQTASRGALLATLAALAIAGVLLVPDLRRSPRVSLPIVGAGIAMVVGALSIAALPQLSTKLSSETGQAGTAALRLNLWRAGVSMANDRPLVGHGPESFNDRFPQYKGADMAARGAERFNGAHNLFVSQSAATGYPGLVLLVGLLVLAAIRAVGTWRRLRHVESSGQEDEATSARAVRLALVAVLAGLVAHLVQASFALPQVGLSFLFWVLLGALCAMSLGVGVPTSLRPRALLDGVMTPPPLGPRWPPARSTPAGRTNRKMSLGTGAVAVLAFAVLLVGISAATRPLRADHNAWGAVVDQAVARRATAQEATRLSRRSSSRLANAIHLNPWEPSYLVMRGDAFYRRALSVPGGSPSQKADLRAAQADYQRALQLRPHSPLLLEQYAEILLKREQVDSTASGARAEAARALWRAVRADPYSAALRERLILIGGG